MQYSELNLCSIPNSKFGTPPVPASEILAPNILSLIVAENVFGGVVI